MLELWNANNVEVIGLLQKFSAKYGFFGIQRVKKSTGAPRTPLWELFTLPDPIVGCGAGFPSPFPTPSASRYRRLWHGGPPTIQPRLRP